jgi:hypothetical protein
LTIARFPAASAPVSGPKLKKDRIVPRHDHADYAKGLGDQAIARAGIEELIDAAAARPHPAPEALLCVAETIEGSEDLAEYGLEFAAAAIVGVDSGDDGRLVLLDKARERPEVGEPLGMARLRRLKEGGALSIEAGLKLGGDGKVWNGNSGRIHGVTPLFVVGRFASGACRSRA